MSKVQGQIYCTSLFQEQAPWCVLKFTCRDMTCLQLANQIGLFFSSSTHCELTLIVPMPQSGCFLIQLPRRVLRVYWLGYLPRSVFRERVSGANSLVCTGLNYLWHEKKLRHCKLLCFQTPNGKDSRPRNVTTTRLLTTGDHSNYVVHRFSAKLSIRSGLP